MERPRGNSPYIFVGEVHPGLRGPFIIKTKEGIEIGGNSWESAVDEFEEFHRQKKRFIELTRKTEVERRRNEYAEYLAIEAEEKRLRRELADINRRLAIIRRILSDMS